MTMETFRKRMLKDGLLFYSLVKKTYETLVQAIEEATKYIKVEDEFRRCGRDKGRDSRREYVLNSVMDSRMRKFEDIIGQQAVRKPYPQLRKSLFSQFLRQNGGSR